LEAEADSVSEALVCSANSEEAFQDLEALEDLEVVMEVDMADTAVVV
jgi:hypothetical protein